MTFTRAFAVIVALISVSVSRQSDAAFGGGGQQNAVGGVVVDPSGLIRTATTTELTEHLAAVRKAVASHVAPSVGEAGTRMISLSKLQSALKASEESGESISDEMRFLAGLQRIEYVFVYPETSDIVIAGPAEPWQVRDDAAVVGVLSGMPVMTLDDLVVAFQSVESARAEGLSCSIEPTAEGRLRLNALLKNFKLRPGQNPAALEPAMREAFGPQPILLTGIDKQSHYARTLVAADYQMKRIAMNLQPSMVDGLPSYLTIAKGQRHSASANPRWWMACNYDALSRTEDKLAWKLSGQGVKTMTDNDLIDQQGNAAAANQSDPLAKKWADAMTQHFDSLARARAVFGELRNCIDLSVIATLIVQEQLATRAGCDLSYLTGSVETANYAVPQAIDPECSFVKGRSGWVVTASGGVDVNAFDVVSNQVEDETLAAIREKTKTTETIRWWWNG